MWKNFFNEFKTFALRGNVIDLAVGVIIGAAFTGVVNSLVKDVIMPPIGRLVGNVNFSDLFINLSREKYPKQLLPLIGADSLLQATVRRVDGIADCELAPPMVVCNEEYRFVIAEQLRLMGQSGTLVLEPVGRNTAPALTLAALAAIREGDDPILLVMPSDHVISDTPAFQAVVRQGAALAEKGAVVTFGITPDAPETGYGYIQSGEPFGGSVAFSIARFVEKPDLATAQSYLDDGAYFWNSGLFMMRASVWLAAIEAGA